MRGLQIVAVLLVLSISINTLNALRCYNCVAPPCGEQEDCEDASDVCGTLTCTSPHSFTARSCLSPDEVESLDNTNGCSVSTCTQNLYICVALDSQGGFEREQIREQLGGFIGRFSFGRLRRFLSGIIYGNPFRADEGTFQELTFSDTYDTDTVPDYYEKSASMSDVSSGFRESGHARVNLLKHNIPKGPCALCGMGPQRRETVYGCLHCSHGGQKYTRLHVVHCFDMWHKMQR
uniref:Uncharacterized protein n=1 Tax=Knipowitschia caucasica TaxID=637954 RepID=A0AAV2L966_KNICA